PRQVRGGRRAGRDRQDGVTRGGAHCGGGGRNARPALTGDGDGDQLRLRSGAAAVRAAAGGGIGARACGSVARRCRRGGRPARASRRAPCGCSARFGRRPLVRDPARPLLAVREPRRRRPTLPGRRRRAPDPDVVDTCLRVTRGKPFLVREFATALSEGSIGSDVRSVGRSVRLRLLRLPEHAGRLARALAILEQSDLLQAARLVGLEELEAAEAADLLSTAGILEPGRPLTFVHPLVRDSIYSELSSAERAQGHRRAAQLLAEQPGVEARVAEHLLVSEPADDGWVVDRLVAAACEAGKHGAPESEAVFLRRALAEPAPAGNRAALLLDLGMAEASIGHADWQEHLQGAVDAAPDAAAAVYATMVLATGL